MRFLLASLYRAPDSPVPDTVPDSVDITCPRCGLRYIADLDPYEEPWDFEEQEWEALHQLAHECPDHRHQFVVGA